MNLLSIGTDREILNSQSDVRARMLLYGPLVDEMYIHCTAPSSVVGEKIADNITVYATTSWFKSFSLIKDLINEKHIDVIVSPDPFAKGWITMCFAWWYKKKFLLSVYGGNIFDIHWKKLSLWNRIYSWIGSMLFARADAIQTDGLETYEFLKQKYGGKVFWKPMVPANRDELLAIKRLNNGSEKKKPQVLYVGRLIEQKNIPFLTRVINEIHELAEVTVVGEGDMKKLLPLEDIQYFPKQSRAEIVHQFAAADMFVLTSYFEGFARVIMEAALAGVPVITTQVSGIQGIVEHEVSGYVIPQGDEKTFIEAVKTLINDPVLREQMSKAIQEKAQNMLSIESMLKSQKAVYDYLI